VGFRGLIHHFDGTTWSPMVSGTTKNLRDVWVDTSGKAVAIGETALHYDGNAWNEMDFPGGYGVWGRSPADVFATSGGIVMHFDGTAWTQSSFWVGQTLYAVHGIGCDVFSVGTGGAVVKYDEGEPVPTLISRFDASATSRGIELIWDIASSDVVVGFHLYRSSDRDRMEHRINDHTIEPSARRYTDTTAQPGARYNYILGVVTDAGEVRSPTVAATRALSELSLMQNYPNPFNPTTLIRFSIVEKSRVTLQIFDAEGKAIATLLNDVVEPGPREILWDGRDNRGNQVSSGVYFCRLRASGRTLSKKMVMIR